MYISLFITSIKKLRVCSLQLKKIEPKTQKKYISFILQYKNILEYRRKISQTNFLIHRRYDHSDRCGQQDWNFIKKWGMRCGYKNLVIVIYISWCYYLSENTFSYLWRSFCETFPSLNKRWPISVLLPLSTWPKI